MFGLPSRDSSSVPFKKERQAFGPPKFLKRNQVTSSSDLGAFEIEIRAHLGGLVAIRECFQVTIRSKNGALAHVEQGHKSADAAMNAAKRWVEVHGPIFLKPPHRRKR